MSEVNMDVINDEPEGGVTAEFELTKAGQKITVKVEAPSYIAVARALTYVAKPENLTAYLIGVSDPEGWEDVEGTDRATKRGPIGPEG